MSGFQVLTNADRQSGSYDGKVNLGGKTLIVLVYKLGPSGEPAIARCSAKVTMDWSCVTRNKFCCKTSEQMLNVESLKLEPQSKFINRHKFIIVINSKICKYVNALTIFCPQAIIVLLPPSHRSSYWIIGCYKTENL